MPNGLEEQASLKLLAIELTIENITAKNIRPKSN
jgi:hypothetical protein